MERDAILSGILKAGVVPVVRTSTPESAIRCVESLEKGGIPVAEVTMTVPGALRALQSLAAEFGDRVLLGAGTVLDRDTARAALQSGARFLLTPGLDVEMIEWARSESQVILAGALTPTEVLKAWKSGADVVRVLPCNAVGGAAYIRSLRAPFPEIPLMPIGGVTLENVGDYFRAGAVGVGVSGALIDSASVRQGRYEIFVERARRFVDAIKRTRRDLAARPNV